MTGVASSFDTMCGGNKRPVPRNSFVPEIAQSYALALFRADFRGRIPAGETFSEWDLFRQNTGRSTIDLTLRQISKDFRNYYSKSQKNRALIAKGTPASGLREGRQLRADGLGLGLDPMQRAIVCELMEVTTVDEADDAMIEDIQPKLALLRGPIKTLVDGQLRELRQVSSVPDKFLASGTPWIIPPDLMIVPIFPETGTSIASTNYRWICFAPTYTYRPMPIGNMVLEPETAPARGLIAYSFHEFTGGASVPVSVFVRFQKWAEQQARAMTRLELLPTPVYTQYWRDNSDDLKLLLGYLGLGVLAIAVVALAIYLAPVIAGSAVALLRGMAAAASAEAFAAASATFIATLSNFLPQILRTTHTALNAATSLAPAYR
jgi:hypothetical protein